MNKIIITGLLILSSIAGFAQSNAADLLKRFNECDSTLSEFDVIDLMLQNRDIAKINLNNGLLEEIQKLEKDSLYSEIEKKCTEVLKANPLNHTALYYLTISQLRLDKKENLECYWAKAQSVYRAITQSGSGTESAPFFVSDLNDAKAFIYLYWADGTILDSMIQKENGLTKAYISNAEGKKEIINFSFNKEIAIRELFFDYHRDFQYYLAESSKPESKYSYKTLLKRFQKQDKTLKKNEIIALMIGFTKNKNYHPYETVENERAIMSLVGDKEYKKALKQSNKLLETNPVNFTALMEQGFSLMKIKDDKSYFPSVESKMVVDAVVWSGNGSRAHPYFVLSPIDGQTLIRYVFGGSIGTMGSGHDSNGYFLDMLDMQKEDQETNRLYFNIDHAMHELRNQIDKVVDKEEEK